MPTHEGGLPRRVDCRYVLGMRCRVAGCAGLVLLAALTSGSFLGFAAAATMPVGATLTTPSSVSAEPVDLNTASPEQLRALPGLGNAYVQRIVEGRPYTAKNQLLTRGVLPQGAYAVIRDRIVARRPLRSP